MAIPESFIDELIAKVDIVELVGKYVNFPKRGSNRHFGLCPFHSEKTPSFSVDLDKQLYYCFGCGVGGGPIHFIMEIENLNFPDAIEFIANIYGMAVPESGDGDGQSEKRRRLLDLNRQAALHFFAMLNAPGAHKAHDYLASRKISKAMVKRFGIGFAPESWNILIDAMAAKGYTRTELIEAGLARNGKTEGSAYDYFRNRLMFPVVDVKGKVIGFSGRALGDAEPKYINSPDTVVFNKSQNLFALNLAKKSKSGMIILVEGNIDVVSLHQAGFGQAVASLGTALTPAQVRLMSRYADKAVLAYDSDEAGRKAAMKAITLFEKTTMSVKVINLGEHKDPDDYIRAKGAAAFSLLLDRSENNTEYRLKTLREKSDLISDDGRIAYLAEATTILSELETKPEREIYAEKVAQVAGVSTKAVENEVEKAIKTRLSRGRKKFETEVTHPAQTVQPIKKSLRYQNEYSAVAEEGVVRSLIKQPALIRILTAQGFKSEEFTSEFLRRVFDLIITRIDNGSEVSPAHILSQLDPDEVSALAAIMHKPDSSLGGDAIFLDYIKKIRAEKYKTRTPDDNLLLDIKKFKETKLAGS
jgi:DNA primase